MMNDDTQPEHRESRGDASLDGPDAPQTQPPATPPSSPPRQRDENGDRRHRMIALGAAGLIGLAVGLLGGAAFSTQPFLTLTVGTAADPAPRANPPGADKLPPPPPPIPGPGDRRPPPPAPPQPWDRERPAPPVPPLPGSGPGPMNPMPGQAPPVGTPDRSGGDSPPPPPATANAPASPLPAERPATPPSPSRSADGQAR
ncbi:hypothetical protein [Mycolicibacterium aromaticivorans]|uniref:hypothetical protein n=1 Tax=Mycolicibacterium aromaticivorans TaxID=318425 RepID=UPI00103C944F|nr:hypothetical protein [Mycolicibacterium aromaticivorans]